MDESDSDLFDQSPVIMGQLKTKEVSLNYDMSASKMNKHLNVIQR